MDEYDQIELIKDYRDSWISMIRTKEVLRILTIPTPLFNKELPDVLFTIEIIRKEREKTYLANVSEVLTSLDKCYEMIARIYQIKSPGKIEIINFDSGTDFRIDFMAVAEVVKQLKEFVLEVWDKIRHKTAKKIKEKHKILHSSLSLVGHIEARVKEGSLKHDVGEQLKLQAINSALGLFDQGAYFAEIIDAEESKAKLLEGFTPKRLPSPKPKTEKTGEGNKNRS